jgi:hypothetical protein
MLLMTGSVPAVGCMRLLDRLSVAG